MDTGQAMVSLIAGSIASRLVVALMAFAFGIALAMALAFVPPLAEWQASMETIVLYAGPVR